MTSRISNRRSHSFPAASINVIGSRMESRPSTVVVKIDHQQRDEARKESASIVSDLDTRAFHQDEALTVAGSHVDDEGGAGKERVVHDEFSMRNKLRNIQLKGRGNEIKSLQDAFDRLQIEREDVTTKGRCSELVMLSGSAGSGKSSLVDNALRNYVNERNGWFISGKFDQHSNCVPFSAIAEALTDLTELLLQAGDDESSALKMRLAKSMRRNKSEVQVLQRVMPNIAMVLNSVAVEDGKTQQKSPAGDVASDPQDYHRPQPSTATLMGDENVAPAGAPSLLQLNTALRSFLRVVASREQPLCMFIDDLQFADLESLDLIQAILSDDKSHHLLVVCTYRDEEFDGASQFEPCSSFRTQFMKAQFLSVGTVDQIVQELVRRTDTEETRVLAELVFRKTLGNAYDVLQFLEQLYMKNLLYVSEEERVWKWDIDDIQKGTDVSENVAHTLIRDKLGRVPTASLTVLQVAATCIGHRFLVHFLEELMATTGMASTAYHDSLRAAMDEGVVESCEVQDYSGEVRQSDFPSQWIKFTHDKVQQAVADMASEDANYCKRLHLRVGRFSLTYRKEVTRESYKDMFLFLALLNLSNCLDLIHDMEEKVGYVRLSLEAGKLASSRCAFERAAKFAKKASSVLPQDVLWSGDNRRLALDLYSFLAEMEMLVRRHDRCREAIETIYSHTTDSVDDRLPAFVTEVENLGFEGRLSDTIQTARRHIRALGERFHAKISPLKLITELFRTKIRLSRLSDEYILSRPLMTDTRMKVVMVLIFKVLSSAQWLSGEDKLMLFCGLRLVRLTLDHGIASEGLSGLGVYGMVEAAMGNYAVSRRFEKLINCSFAKRADTLPLLKDSLRGGLVYMASHLWKTVEDCSYEMESYAIVGINGIDLANSATALLGSWSVRSLCKPWTLPTLIQEIDSLRREALSLGVLRREIIANCPNLQYCLNLRGEEGSDSAKLDGSAIDIMRSLEPEQSLSDSTDVWVTIWQVHLSYQFEDWRYLKEHVMQVETLLKNHIGTRIQMYQILLFLSMSALELYSQTKTRRFLSLCKRCRKRLKQLENCGSPNATAPLLLVNAEYALIKYGGRRSNQEIEEGYQKALVEARKSSWIAESICLDRLLAFYCSCGNEPKARYHFAMLLDDVCDPWGATGLAVHFSRKYAFLENR